MSNPSDSQDRAQELAQQRTDTAFRRTFLAEQRTYSAWLRTGLASSATGFAMANLLTETDPQWLVRTLSVIFVTAGAVMFALAFWAYRNALQRMNETSTNRIHIWIVGLLSLVLTLSAMAGLFLLFPT